MAIIHEHVPSWTSGALSRAIAERVHLGLPTLVLDRRVVSDEIEGEDQQAEAVISGSCTTINLADPSRWIALIVPDAGRLQGDLQDFARALAIWCAPLKVPAPGGIPHFAKPTGSPRITDVVRALYDEASLGGVVHSIGDDLRHWRSVLRDLGEGPRAVVDDPWFSHLFLSTKAGEFPLVRPYTLVELRSPEVPCRAAQRIAAVVLDFVIQRAQRHDPSSREVVCFVLQGCDLENVLSNQTAEYEKNGLNSKGNVRFVWIDEVDNDGGRPKLAFPHGEESFTSEDDKDLYLMFSTTMDHRHRGAYVKGIMYGYAAFCTLDKPDALPDDLISLGEAGMILGMSSPLITLFDDC